jgi:hypothetical protein
MSTKKKPERPSWKQWMTFSDKGEIFYLYDSGKNVDEISEITGYSPKRLRFLIEGIFATDTWNEAIATYQEVNNYGNNDKGHRDVRTSIGLGRGRVRDVTTRDVTKDFCKGETYRGVGGTRDEIATHQGVKKQVSRIRSRPAKYKPKSPNRGVQSRGGRRRSNDRSLIDKLRDHKDYRGE